MVSETLADNRSYYPRTPQETPGHPKASTRRFDTGTYRFFYGKHVLSVREIALFIYLSEIEIVTLFSFVLFCLFGPKIHTFQPLGVKLLIVSNWPIIKHPNNVS